MRRRKLLAALPAAIPFATWLHDDSGRDATDSSRSSTGTPDVEVTAPTVSPGESAAVEIDATAVAQLRFSDVPTVDVAFAYDDVEFSTPPSAVWDVLPPTWQWSEARNVGGTVPFTVSPDVEPGEYRYSLAARPADADRSVAVPFVISVER